MFKKVDHIGVAVKNLEETIQYYVGKMGGTQIGPVFSPPGMGVSIAKISLGNVIFEFIEVTDRKSPMAGFIEKHGEGLHHLGVEVDDVNKAIQSLSANGIKAIDKQPMRRGDHVAAYIYPEAMNGVSVEMMEFPKKA